MDEPIIQTIPQDPLPSRHQTPWWKFAIGFLVIVALGIIVDAIWVQYFSPAAQDTQQMKEQYAAYEQQQKEYEEAMQQDTYGGKTPEETLTLFIDALEKEDLDLASKYFVLNTNKEGEDYAIKNEWIEALYKSRTENRIKNIADIIKQAVPSKRDTGSSEIKEFVVLEENEAVNYSIILKFNNYSQIWKIESL